MTPWRVVRRSITCSLVSPLLSVLLLLQASEARAQFGAIGVKGGVNWTSLSGDPPSEGGSGFIGGLYASGHSGTTVAQFEILFSKRSFTDPAGGPAGGPLGVSESFIQIPALFGFRGGAGALHAMLYAGPSFSIKTACNADAGNVRVSCSTAGIEDKGSLWSLVGGLAIDFQAGRTTIFFDGRYDNGLTNAFEDRDGKWRSWIFMMGFGYLMPT